MTCDTGITDPKASRPHPAEIRYGTPGPVAVPQWPARSQNGGNATAKRLADAVVSAQPTEPDRFNKILARL
ncbi:hypothetical protein [Streptomyces albipurpureus]|uniref:Uncharacterized protein n=1 Tax=Streptomyces albipurpureus TaxID=2897419 RepID=A0ABT0UW38_9ACTN|nr:hypothetical protein [Streptomyces sp. CWNU-1]MCM2392802.1 hypothetical protein [Streptomyces sp. CWNU-1]